jgi:hypothetical protein
MAVRVQCEQCGLGYTTELPFAIVQRVARCEHCGGPLAVGPPEVRYPHPATSPGPRADDDAADA